MKPDEKILAPYRHLLMLVHDNPGLQYKIRKALMDAWFAGRLYQSMSEKSDRAIPEPNTTDK